jgi:hypothetical protein
MLTLPVLRAKNVQPLASTGGHAWLAAFKTQKYLKPFHLKKVMSF